MSVSTFNGYEECAAKQFAQEHGAFTPDNKEAFAFGTVAHAGVLEPETLPAVFMQDDIRPFFFGNPSADQIKEIFADKKMTVKKALQLRPELAGTGEPNAMHAEVTALIQRVRTSPGFSAIFTGGTAEAMFTGTLAGVPWRIRMDYYVEGGDLFVDLKTAKDFENKWDESSRKKLPWYQRYKRQMAVYQVIARQNVPAAGWLPVIVGVTKQDPADLAVIQFSNETMLAEQIAFIEQEMPKILRWRAGETCDIDEHKYRCGKCEYCRASKTLENCIETAQSAL
jgi:hypothetical protein